MDALLHHITKRTPERQLKKQLEGATVKNSWCKAEGLVALKKDLK